MGVLAVCRLQEQLLAAGLPVSGVRSDQANAVDWGAAATPQQKAAGQVLLAAFDWSDAADDAWLAAKDVPAAKQALDAPASTSDRLVRALALVVLDEVNILRAAASLAPRTVVQLINAIKAKL